MPPQRLVTGVMTGLVTLRRNPNGCRKALIQRRAWARDKDPRRRDKDHARAPTGGMRECARIEVVIQIFLSDSQRFVRTPRIQPYSFFAQRMLL